MHKQAVNEARVNCAIVLKQKAQYYAGILSLSLFLRPLEGVVYEFALWTKLVAQIQKELRKLFWYIDAFRGIKAHFQCIMSVFIRSLHAFNAPSRRKRASLISRTVSVSKY